MAGGIFSGANPTYVAREVAFQLEDSGAKFMLVAPGSLDVGLNAASEINLPKSKVLAFDSSATGGTFKGGVKHWSSLLASEDEAEGFEWDSCTKPGESDKTIGKSSSCQVDRL